MDQKILERAAAHWALSHGEEQSGATVSSLDLLIFISSLLLTVSLLASFSIALSFHTVNTFFVPFPHSLVLFGSLFQAAVVFLFNSLAVKVSSENTNSTVLSSIDLISLSLSL